METVHSLLSMSVPKKGKTVCLLSTMHNNNGIDPDSDEARKPEIVSFYNMTKAGIDTVDQMCGSYAVNRKTRRWPLVVFFHMMNGAAINEKIVLLSALT